MRRHSWQARVIPAVVVLGFLLFFAAFYVANGGDWRPTAFWQDSTASAAATHPTLTQIVVNGKTVTVPVKVKGTRITVPTTVVRTHGELVTVTGGVITIPGPGQTSTQTRTITGPGGTTTVVTTLPGTTTTLPGSTTTLPGTTETVTVPTTITIPTTVTQTDTVTETVTTTQPPVS